MGPQMEQESRNGGCGDGGEAGEDSLTGEPQTPSRTKSRGVRRIQRTVEAMVERLKKKRREVGCRLACWQQDNSRQAVCACAVRNVKPSRVKRNRRDGKKNAGDDGGGAQMREDCARRVLGG